MTGRVAGEALLGCTLLCSIFQTRLSHSPAGEVFLLRSITAGIVLAVPCAPCRRMGYDYGNFCKRGLYRHCACAFGIRVWLLCLFLPRDIVVVMSMRCGILEVCCFSLRVSFLQAGDLISSLPASRQAWMRGSCMNLIMATKLTRGCNVWCVVVEL